MTPVEERLEASVSFLQGALPAPPEVAIILGTGLGGLLARVEEQASIPYGAIPHFPEPTVESHHGKLVLGSIGGKTAAIFSGRFHYYEGYGFEEIVLPVRVAKKLGAQVLLISNAVGGLNPGFAKGDLMLTTDHINLLPGNPLVGQNPDSLGPRFPDMSAPYDPALLEAFRAASRTTGLPIREGVYIAAQGPMLETRAEYRMLRMLGADAVGMSTVPEVIAANHCGLPCAAVSVITDVCDPDNLAPIDVPEIIRVAGEAEPKLVRLFEEVIQSG